MSKILKYSSFITISFLAGCLVYKALPKKSSSQSATQYVVIGCSAAGFYAAKDLAKLDGSARVVCISYENSMPYNKTNFHSYIARNGQKSSRVNINAGNAGIEFMLGTKVLSINSDEKTLILADKKILHYDKLLIATGAQPQAPPSLLDKIPSSHIRFYNTKDDLNAILSAVDSNPLMHVAIIGAGIRSLELSDGLKRRHKDIKLSILNRSAQFLGQHSDVNADKFIAERLKKADINFIAPASISAINDTGKNYTLIYDNGQLEADFIVFAMGTVPNSELAKEAGLELYADGSIKVDNELRTTKADIYAAGDVVGTKNPFGEGWLRAPKWRTAKKQGQIAAANMLGQHKSFNPEIAAFISSFFGMKTVISGDVRSQPISASLIKAEPKRYYRYVLVKERLNAFITIWDKGQKKPNIFLLRRKLIDQSPVNAAELLH